MSGFAKVALSIALIAIIVLSIVVASVAWFTSNPEVNANDVTLNAAKTLTVSFDSSEDETSDKYNGQIGNVPTGADAPFVYDAGSFTVRLTSLSSTERRGRIKVEFGTVMIETLSSGTISDVLLTDLFHLTANIYKEDENGTYVKDEETSKFRTAVAVDDDALPHYSKAIDPLTISDSGVLMDGASEARFVEGTYVLAFTYTFLPEDAYAVWTAATQEEDYEKIYGYEFSPLGAFIGVVGYVPYNAKYHYGQQLYTRSGTEGNYTYQANNDTGTFVRVVTGYEAYNDVTKYDANHNEAPQNGRYIKIADTDEYVEYFRYNRINGFPYSDDRYLGEKFTFTVFCTVEEV